MQSSNIKDYMKKLLFLTQGMPKLTYKVKKLTFIFNSVIFYIYKSKNGIVGINNLAKKKNTSVST